MDQAKRPDRLLVIAGGGVYPVQLAASARRAGVREIVALAFRGETDRAIGRVADRVAWLPLHGFQRFLDTARDLGIPHAVMVGLIRPRHLFFLRFDTRARAVLAQLQQRNAETIFGAVADELGAVGIDVLPAHRFMEDAMPAPGVLSRRAPDARVAADIALALRIARAAGDLDIGQTAIVKNGTVLAVEAFEGTDRAIRRAGRLGGAGAVMAKTAKRDHDMRFDIPVVGERTLRGLRRIRAAGLAVEARRTILLDRERLASLADRWELCLTAEEVDRGNG